MSNIIKLIIFTCALSFVSSCTTKHEVVDESKGIHYKTQEILVRQCADISNHELNQLLEAHEVSILRQVSPHLYVATWSDGRHADAVVHALDSTTMFCGVDKYQK